MSALGTAPGTGSRSLSISLAEEGRGARAGFCFCALEAPAVPSQEVALVRWQEHRPTRSLHLASNLIYLIFSSLVMI